MRATTSAVLVAMILAANVSPALGEDAKPTAHVKAEADRIKDGDTPLIEIRMYGVDTPEKDQKCEDENGNCYACGRRATEALKELLNEKLATYAFTGAVTYGRPVATIYVDDLDVNEKMIEDGMGIALPGFMDKTPDQRSRYLAAQKKAKKAKRGIWQGKFIKPELFRDGAKLPCE